MFDSKPTIKPDVWVLVRWSNKTSYFSSCLGGSIVNTLRSSRRKQSADKFNDENEDYVQIYFSHVALVETGLSI